MLSLGTGILLPISEVCPVESVVRTRGDTNLQSISPYPHCQLFGREPESRVSSKDRDQIHSREYSGQLLSYPYPLYHEAITKHDYSRVV
jgi:hypothetical protein